MSETGRYLYAVARGLDPAAMDGVRGLGGGFVEVVEHAGLQAVVDTVDLAEYGEAALRRNLEDLGWLEAAARGHDAVIQAAALSAPTAPLRLATICLDDDGVRARLEEWRGALTTVLDRIDGRDEWSVKVFARPVEPEPVAAGTTSGGTAYLQRKRAQATARTERQESAMRSVELLDRELSALAVATRRLQPQDPRLSGVAEPMLANIAYLVERADRDAFARRVAELSAATGGADEGGDAATVDVTLGGPWPPYSFAVLDPA